MQKSWWQAVPTTWHGGSDWPSVDLMVRSHAGELSKLLLLMRSIELYWPIGRWGVVVILDDNPWDAAVALMLPSYVTVVLESTPPIWEEFKAVPRRMHEQLHISHSQNLSMQYNAQDSRGYVRAQWSQFHADTHSNAEFIAWLDTDCILFTYVTPTLLFEFTNATDSGAPSPWRSIVAGIDHPMIYWPSIRTLGWPWVCEFMVGFPFVLHRQVFTMARAAVVKSFQELTEPQNITFASDLGSHFNVLGSEYIRSSEDEFANAFAWLGRSTWNNFRGRVRDGRLLPCATTILGHVAYLFRTQSLAEAAHVFSIHAAGGSEYWPHGALRDVFEMRIGPEGIPIENRCPALRGAIHLGYWSQYDKSLSPEKYFKFGVHLMSYGLCGEIRWPKQHIGMDQTDMRALCVSLYCADCPSLLILLGLAHDGYKVPWGMNSPGCPSTRQLPYLFKRYTSDWMAIAKSLSFRTHMDEGIGKVIFAGSPDQIKQQLFLQDSYHQLLRPTNSEHY